MNKLFTYLFAVLGISALIAALFFGATHHFFTSAICSILYIVGRREIRIEKNSVDSPKI